VAKLLFWPPPIVRWLPRYTRQQALGDVLGGLTVAVMVVPQVRG
jgi:MFS superfamily sulfate permease-like transporter